MVRSEKAKKLFAISGKAALYSLKINQTEHDRTRSIAGGC